MRNQSKVFFSIFWANRKLPLCWCESHTLFHLFATLALFSITYPTVSILPSLFILHSSLFILHSSLFILHHIPKLIRLATPFILHSSLFTLKNYPTLPSKLISKSFWASTANSIGSLLSTSLPKPFTMREIAFSVSIPR